VRRRIAALEAALDTKLFDARENRYVLTPQGEKLLPAAENIESAALGAEGEVAATGLSASGTVRIGAPDGFGIHYLAPRIAKLCQRHPDLDVQLMITSIVFNPSKRDADIAIVPSPPTRGRQITRKITDCNLGLFGAREYLETAPPIRSIEDLQNHRLIGYAEDQMFTPDIDFLRQIDPSLRPAIESSNIAMQFRVTLAGGGLCVMPFFMAAGEPSLQRVLPELVAPVREYWMVVPAELKRLARFRAVCDFLVEQVKADRALFLESPAPRARLATERKAEAPALKA